MHVSFAQRCVEHDALRWQTYTIAWPAYIYSQARSLSVGSSIAFVLVSQQAWGSGEFEDLPPMPTLHFANYAEKPMVAALERLRAAMGTGSGTGGWGGHVARTHVCACV